MDWDPDQRYWDDRRKHMPLEHVEWKDVVKSTRHGDSHYVNGLSPAEIETLELECVTDGIPLPDNHPTRRRFYREHQNVVGASKGEETNIVYSEWHKGGAVHGRPITREELRKKGL